MSVPALKEWSAAVHALLDGRQRVLLRKGGIHEKRFRVSAGEFLLFPTVAHGHAERLRPEHRDLLGRAAADSTAQRVLIGAAARVTGAVQVDRTEGLQEIEDLHIWTTESVRADRLDFRPRQRLTVLVLAVRALPEPIELARTPEFGGCRSWLELPVPAGAVPPVQPTDALAGITARVSAAVG
ncbi:DUF1802 family protein [Mycolicibacterium fallax]|uniref:Uncharacterized protein n=1 Tax=Mycolicibacterium fallax TaxID=1793 RepID=A0A1X1RGV1_MYCFA|nr:DUF1802 family protein [Mycolicibacterium fallax]ORV05573.1 hypothetical protein AWC04_06900 [Mycolicibacterium fallax]BBY96879.1 hypothetical protein MFAL_03460 [Mycolicibacterium fallax]